MESTIQAEKTFNFELITPYATQENAPQTQFVVSGLFREGGLSALVAKPKQGKSSLSRYAAVCISKGVPFLGRDTKRGGSLIISIEDPPEHVSVCLKALGYNLDSDAPIRLIDKASSSFTENIAALRQTLRDHPEFTFVVIDTLAKFVHARDFNDYSSWLPIFEEFRKLGREFPQVSILCLLHAKKVMTGDPFDSMLGSSALRGEFDTTAAVYQEDALRVIVTESRIGRVLQPTILMAGVTQSGDTTVVDSFSLGSSLDELNSQRVEAIEKGKKQALRERIIAHLVSSPEQTASYQNVLNGVTGKSQDKVKAIASLVEENIISASGVKNSPINPYTLTLGQKAVETDQLAMADVDTIN